MRSASARLLFLLGLACGTAELSATDLPATAPSPVPAVRREPVLTDARLYVHLQEQREEGTLKVTSFTVTVAPDPVATRTHLDLELESSLPWQAEGVLRLPIPPGAAVTRAVLHVGDRPMEGALVERQRARQIYQSITERRRDPALVVWSGAEWVDVNIFPFEPKGRRRFELEWTEPTAYENGQAWYRVPVLSDRGAGPVRPGLLRIVGGRDAPVVPSWVRLDLPTPPALASTHGPGAPFGYAFSAAPAEPPALPQRVLVLAETSAAMTSADRLRQRGALAQLAKRQLGDFRWSLAAVDWVTQPLESGAGNELELLDRIPSAGTLDLGTVLLDGCHRAVADRARAVLFVGRGDHGLAGDPFEAPLRCLREAGIALIAIGTAGAVPSPLADAAALTGGSDMSSGQLDDAALSLVLTLQRAPPSALQGRIEGWRPLLTVTQEVRWVGRYFGAPPLEAVTAPAALEALWSRSLPREQGGAGGRPVLSPLTSILVLETDGDYQRFGLAVPETDPEALGRLMPVPPPQATKAPEPPETAGARPDARIVRTLRVALEAKRSAPAKPTDLQKSHRAVARALSVRGAPGVHADRMQHQATAGEGLGARFGGMVPGSLGGGLGFGAGSVDGRGLHSMGLGPSLGGLRAYGSAQRTRGDPTVPLGTPTPTVMGSLDKEVIRKVIHANRGQIRFCFESQLLRMPLLGGKVAVKFLITPNGTVSHSQVAQSSVGNPELESCVASRVRTWMFPRPAGGGVVIVTYPFLFGEAGGGIPVETAWARALKLFKKGRDTAAIARELGAPPELGLVALGWWSARPPLGRHQGSASDPDALTLAASLLWAGAAPLDARRVLSESQLDRARPVFLTWGLADDAARLEPSPAAAP